MHQAQRLRLLISKQKQSNASQLWVPVFSLAFCVWEILLFRVNTASGLSVTGFLDDVLLVSAVTGAVTLLVTGAKDR